MRTFVRHSLFWKIFGWFWLAQALLGLVLIGVTTAMLPKPNESEWRDITAHTLALHARLATAILDREGQKGLDAYLLRLEQQAHIRATVLNAHGEDLRGKDQPKRVLPPQASTLIARVAENSTASLKNSTGRRKNTTEDNGAKPQLQVHGNSVLGAQEIRSASGRRYIFAAEMPRLQIRVIGAPLSLPVQALLPDPALSFATPPSSAPRDVVTYAVPSHSTLPSHPALPPHPALSAAHNVPFSVPPASVLTRQVQGPDGVFVAGDADDRGLQTLRVGWHINGWDYPLRLLALLLTTSVVCYALARYLAAPAITLRTATERLAEGDLSARVGPAMGRRRDELADLGHTFDRMAERIESLVQSERRLLGDISHELRSPLARLAVALELARQDAGPKAQPALNRIDDEAARLNELIGQLLVLTRLESGTIEPHAQTVDIVQLVRSIASDAAFEARGHNRKVRLVQLDAACVQGVPHLLRSAIENVVRNSVHYTREGTCIEISVVCSELSTATLRPAVLICVQDQGPGVPHESLPHLFQPFYRVDSARDEQSGGAGLGLSITERAVRLHGGSVRAQNAPGAGLLIEICLPVQASNILQPSKECVLYHEPLSI